MNKPIKYHFVAGNMIYAAYTLIIYLCVWKGSYRVDIRLDLFLFVVLLLLTLFIYISIIFMSISKMATTNKFKYYDVFLKSEPIEKIIIFLNLSYLLFFMLLFIFKSQCYFGEIHSKVYPIMWYSILTICTVLGGYGYNYLVKGRCVG